MTPTSSSTGQIDAYLDDLACELRVDRRRMRRILLETQDHLLEAAATARVTGLSDAEAEEQAIARFGSARTVARRFAAEEGRLLPPSLILNLALALVLLGSIGATAVGLSGGLAAAFGAAFGKSFVAGDTPGNSYSAARCADFLRFEPQAHDCEAAATAHHFGEVIWYRVALGALGVLGLGALALGWRRYPRTSGVRMLPEAFVPTVGAALFGVASVGMLLQSVGALLFQGGTGTGNILSGGVVAAVAFAGFGAMLLHTLKRHTAFLPRVS